MKVFLFLFLLLLAPTTLSAQSRSNDSIRDQINELGAAKHTVVEYNASSNVTTIRAVAENFAEGETKAAGARAMNFAVGMMYVGRELKNASEPFKMAFWVNAQKPVFAQGQPIQIYAGEALVEIRDARHIRRDRDNMEYLNFQLTREQLKTIALYENVRVYVGRHSFTFTKSQLKLMADLFLATELNPE
jgi:hypothetical protein